MATTSSYPLADLSACPPRITSRDVVVSYMRRRLREYLACPDGPVGRSLKHRLLCDQDLEGSNTVQYICKFEDAVLARSHHMSVMSQAVNLMPNQVSSEEARRGYLLVQKKLYEDGNVTWNRLMMTLIYTHHLAAEAMRCNNMCRVVDLADWCCTFIREQSIDCWVQSKGGWEMNPGFLGIQSRPANPPPANCPPVQPVQRSGAMQVLTAIGGLFAAISNELHRE